MNQLSIFHELITYLLTEINYLNFFLYWILFHFYSTFTSTLISTIFLLEILNNFTY